MHDLKTERGEQRNAWYLIAGRASPYLEACAGAAHFTGRSLVETSIVSSFQDEGKQPLALFKTLWTTR